tara:strand:- start:8923 stop:9138 length:216 start_codon:yes stop_codon:yes gene_type:complete
MIKLMKAMKRGPAKLVETVKYLGTGHKRVEDKLYTTIHFETHHILMTPDEARKLAKDLIRMAGETDKANNI